MFFMNYFIPHWDVIEKSARHFGILWILVRLFFTEVSMISEILKYSTNILLCEVIITEATLKKKQLGREIQGLKQFLF